MSILTADTLEVVFEYLVKFRDQKTLRSCLLVNRLWCAVSVEKLWKDMWNYNTSSFGTLIACLPNESKEILRHHGIVISIPTSNAPTFEYASFCKILSINKIYKSVEDLLEENQQNIQNFEKQVVIQELLKFFMNKISSLKYLDCHLSSPVINFTSFPGAKACLKNLSELKCQSCTYFGFFDQLALVCYNIQSLGVTFRDGVSSGLKDLISVQKNLKQFDVALIEDCDNDMLEVLEKLPNTLTTLSINGEDYVPLSFISKFTNLQVLDVSIYYSTGFEDFKSLKNVTFPRLEVLRFHEARPSRQLLIDFLEKNGRNLKEIHINKNNKLIRAAIATHCPNLE